MKSEIKEAEENLFELQKFLFSMRKFFYENPNIQKEYEKFLSKKENLIF